MTREKFTKENALRILRLWRDEYDTNSRLPNAWALEMAISALEQVVEIRKLIAKADETGMQIDYGVWQLLNALEKIVGEKIVGEFEQEPCEDVVNRKAVLKWLEFIYDKINELPPVQPSHTQMVDKSNFDIRQYRADLESAYECGKASVQPSRKVIENIKTEIEEYKDDKVIHAERNEMIDIVLNIIDKHTSGKE